MKTTYILLLVLFSHVSWAMGPHGEIEDLSELAPLPAYCKGTLVTRFTLHDPKPLAEYVAIYGTSFNDTHHYCWALNTENHLSKMDDYTRKNMLGHMLGNIKYVLDQAPLTFSLLPEIYLSKARILFKFNNNVEAVDTLFKLTQIKPGHALAYAQLGDHFQRVGDKRSAIKYYEQGLINTNKKNADFFIFKIKKLDDTYKAPLINSRAKVDEAAPNGLPDQTISPDQKISEDNSHSTPIPPPSTPTSATPASPTDHAAQNPTADQAAKPNPYCRFCP